MQCPRTVMGAPCPVSSAVMTAAGSASPASTALVGKLPHMDSTGEPDGACMATTPLLFRVGRCVTRAMLWAVGVTPTGRSVDDENSHDRKHFSSAAVTSVNGELGSQSTRPQTVMCQLYAKCSLRYWSAQHHGTRTLPHTIYWHARRYAQSQTRRTMGPNRR